MEAVGVGGEGNGLLGRVVGVAILVGIAVGVELSAGVAVERGDDSAMDGSGEGDGAGLDGGSSVQLHSPKIHNHVNQRRFIPFQICMLCNAWCTTD